MATDSPKSLLLSERTVPKSRIVASAFGDLVRLLARQSARELVDGRCETNLGKASTPHREKQS